MSSSLNPPALEEASELESQVLTFEYEGRYAEVESIYLEILRLKISACGNGSSQVATTKSSLADLYIKMGRLDEAKKLLEEVIVIFNKEYECDYDGGLNLACARDNLGRVYEMKGFFKKAIEWRTKGDSSYRMVCSYSKCPKYYTDAPFSNRNGLRSCTRCKCVFYCDEVCQRKDWDTMHKKACKTPSSITAPGT